MRGKEGKGRGGMLLLTEQSIVTEVYVADAVILAIDPSSSVSDTIKHSVDTWSGRQC